MSQKSCGHSGFNPVEPPRSTASTTTPSILIGSSRDTSEFQASDSVTTRMFKLSRQLTIFGDHCSPSFKTFTSREPALTIGSMASGHAGRNLGEDLPREIGAPAALRAWSGQPRGRQIPAPRCNRCSRRIVDRPGKYPRRDCRRPPGRCLHGKAAFGDCPSTAGAQRCIRRRRRSAALSPMKPLKNNRRHRG